MRPAKLQTVQSVVIRAAKAGSIFRVTKDNIVQFARAQRPPTVRLALMMEADRGRWEVEESSTEMRNLH